MKYSILLFLIGFYSVAFAQKEKKYLAQVSLDGKYGFIDASGHEIIPLIYDDAGMWGGTDAATAAGVDLRLKMERQPALPAERQAQVIEKPTLVFPFAFHRRLIGTDVGAALFSKQTGNSRRLHEK